MTNRNRRGRSRPKPPSRIWPYLAAAPVAGFAIGLLLATRDDGGPPPAAPIAGIPSHGVGEPSVAAIAPQSRLTVDPPPRVRPPAPETVQVEEAALRMPRETVAPPPATASPRIAVILDDIGLDRPSARRAMALPAPVTLSFLPYAEDLPRQVEEAERRGHEIFVHLPMEPLSTLADPGPDALLSTSTPEEFRRRLLAGLDRVPGAVGANNHMGSRLTADAGAMARVMSEMRDRGLVFVDSRTTSATVAESAAAAAGVPHGRRDVFLDNERAPERIRDRLAELEERARAVGTAIGIGHPYPETLDALAEWLPAARARGISIVPASTLTIGGKAGAAEASRR